jgi:hypothetical protein
VCVLCVCESFFWGGTQPFLPGSHWARALFLPQRYALEAPLALLVAGVSGIALFITLQKAAKRRQQAEKAKKAKKE